MSDAFRLGVRPPSLLTCPDWATDNVKIANSERSSKFDIDQTPWARKPMECAGDLETRQVVYYAPTGCGKSTMAEGIIPWVVSEDPGPFLYASQTDPDSKFWVETRLMHALKSCHQIKNLWPSDRHKTRSTDIIFPHMPFISGGANMSNFQEKSVRYLYGDEVWKWKPGLVREFLARHHDRWNRKVFLVSQAGFEDDELESAWQDTDQAEWSYKCKCGEMVRYSRSLLYYKIIKTKGVVDKQKTADTTKLVSPCCGAAYKDTAKIRRQLANNSDYVATNSNPIRGHRGFRMHRLAIWWIPWSRYTLNLLNAKEALDKGNILPWKQLSQKDDCIPWNDEMAIMKVEASYSEEPMSTRDPLEKIEGETHRFMTCDKGGDHFWGVVRAWSKTHHKSELLWEGYIPSRPNEEGITDIQKKYGVEDRHVFVDVSFEWAETHQICADKGWTGIRGEGKVNSFTYVIKGRGKEDRLYSKVKYAKGERGSRSRYIEIATNPIKDMLQRLRSGQGIEFTIPPDTSKAYHNHMKAEIREEVESGKSRNIVGHWKQIKRANHLFDCEVYNVAAALVYGVFN